MKKNYIKQLFALLLVTLFAGNVNAQDEVVFNFNEMNLDMSWNETKDKDTGEILENASNAGDILEAWSKTIDGVTITVSPKSSGNNENRFWRLKDSEGNGYPQLRCYSGTITITSEENIAEVSFDAATDKFSLSPNIGTLNGRNWAGSAMEIIFTVNGNSQINAITITLGEGTENPEIVNTVVTATETFNFNAMNVPVSSGTGDNYDPAGELTEDLNLTEGVVSLIATASSEGDKTPNRFWSTNNGPQLRLYNGTLTISSTGDQVVGVSFGANANDVNLTPDKGQLAGTEWKGLEDEVVFTVTASTKINSITVKIGKKDESGDDTQKVDNIEAFKAIGKNNEAKLNLNDALVLFVKGDDVFVHDQSGAIDFYKTGIDFTAGQVMNGSIYGLYDEFNSLPELKSVEGKTNTDDITFSTGSVTPMTGIDLSEVAAYACELVTVKLTISKDGNSYFGEDEDGNKLQVYDKFGIGYNPADIEGKTFNITGIIIPYKTTFEIAPTEDFVGAPDVTVSNIAEFKSLDDETTAILTLTNAQVQLVDASDTRNVYVKDATGGIVFYNSHLTLENGDIMNGTIKAQYKNYNGIPELQKVVNSDIEITSGTAVPETMTLSEAASADNLCKLVKIADVTVTKEEEAKEDGTPVVRWFDQNNTIQFYDKLKIGYELQDGNTYTFTGVMTLFNEAPEMIVSVDPTNAGATAISNVNAEQNANAPIYNMAGQRVSNAVKGVFIQNGKKFVIK